MKSPRERIKKLENLLAIEVRRAAELLEENQKLESELKTTQAKMNAYKKHFEKLNAKNKIPCDRSKAMVEYGEIDLSEVIGSK